MTKVKICGLMEKEHVTAAIEAGADAIGFVFASSKRKITVEKAHELAKSIPTSVLKIGVFVNPTQEEIKTAFYKVPLDIIQYHGSETVDFIHSASFPSIKAFALRSEKDIDHANQYDTDFLLFDAPQAGSGLTFDWKLMEGLNVSQEKVILAGGLNIENVKEAINRVKPYMVDVSSGVERQGRKDEQLIRAFINAVKDEER